jgi:hypothetical protein
VAAWLTGIWDILLESSLLFLIGLVLAGLLWYFLSERDLKRLMTGGRGKGVLRAALVGIPLPLCSCSVLPVATQLRRSGVSKGAVASFLIATPETGIDSIMLTYALTDPVLTIARPVTAFITALAAGGVEAVGGSSQVDRLIAEAPSCGCDSGGCATPSLKKKRTLFESFKYAFTEIMGDLAPYLLLGFVLAGLAGALLGDSVSGLPAFFREGWGGYAGAVIVGLPLYICASASTPLAAVLLGAGFSPGMVLVFMLVGPATNISALVVVRQLLGGAATLRYLLVIVIVSIGAGLLIDQVYTFLQIVPNYHVQTMSHEAGLVQTASAVLLIFLMLYWTIYKLIRRLQKFSL